MPERATPSKPERARERAQRAVSAQRKRSVPPCALLAAALSPRAARSVGRRLAIDKDR